jgi:urease accessory protein
MYDAACPSESQVFQRARGGVSVSFKRRGPHTVLDALRQEGCLKARFPRVEPSEWTMAVTLNTSGGVAGGDRLVVSATVGEGAQACLTTQAAERYYRSVTGGTPAEVRTQLSVSAGASVEWLPQETILFDRSSVSRQLHVDLAPDGWFLGIESLVFGRAAMGEQLRQAQLRDLIRIRRDGSLLLHDAIRLDGDVHAALARRSVASGAGALATIVHVAPAAEAALPAVRDVLVGQDSAASAWNRMLVVRILAPDSACLRRLVAPVLAVLRDGRPLPRPWLC